MTTATSDKLKSMEGLYLEKSVENMEGSTFKEVNNASYLLPLESIGIKDVPKSDSPARMSQSLIQS